MKRKWKILSFGAEIDIFEGTENEAKQTIIDRMLSDSYVQPGQLTYVLSKDQEFNLSDNEATKRLQKSARYENAISDFSIRKAKILAKEQWCNLDVDYCNLSHNEMLELFYVEGFKKAFEMLTTEILG